MKFFHAKGSTTMKVCHWCKSTSDTMTCVGILGFWAKPYTSYGDASKLNSIVLTVLLQVWSMGYKSKKYPVKQINWFPLSLLSREAFSVLNSLLSLSLYKRALQELWLQMEHNMVHLSSKDEVNKWVWCLLGVEWYNEWMIEMIVWICDMCP